MENNIHKGSDLNNVSETWDQNERKRESGNNPGVEGAANKNVPPANDLDRAIKKEAADYDNDNKENRLLSGDRASINDDASGE